MDNEDNGILSSVPGQYIAQAARALPDPATALRQRASAVIDTTAAWAGVVRIYYQPQKMRHGKNRHWVWVAYWAEPERPVSNRGRQDPAE